MGFKVLSFRKFLKDKSDRIGDDFCLGNYYSVGVPLSSTSPGLNEGFFCWCAWPSVWHEAVWSLHISGVVL